MDIRLIEAKSKAGNWGKFMVGAFTDEWSLPSAVRTEESFSITRTDGVMTPLLTQCGWTRNHIMVFDIQTGEGAMFAHGGFAVADLDKKQIWVCPLFEPFLTWLYQQPRDTIPNGLPLMVELDHPLEMRGYRRQGKGRAESKKPDAP